MVKVIDIFNCLNEFAPVDMKMDFDNVGLLVGRAGGEVSRILVALDITDQVISEAKAMGAELIAAHHPMFFSLKTVNDTEPTGRRILELAKSGISAICMHTNLDAAGGGVNDALAEKAGIAAPELLAVDGCDENGSPYCIGRWGELSEPVEFKKYLGFIKKQLGCNGLRYVSAGRPVRRVAVVGGSGGSEIAKAIAKGCDTYVTADVKYHQFMEAREAGLNIIDAGHFCTENVVVPVLAEKLAESFPDVEVRISTGHRQIEQFC